MFNIKFLLALLALLLIITLILILINCFKKDYLNDNNNNQRIPKIIYQTWFTKYIPEEILEYRNKMLKKNADYKYYLYDDTDMDNYVRNNFDNNTYLNFNKLKVPTAKADFWRYLILYKTGGIYLDMDSTIDINLNNFINKNEHAILSKEKNEGYFLQWCLIFNKNHPILKEVINLVNYNISNNLYKDDIISLTGPGVYTKAIHNIHNKYFTEPLLWKNKEKNKIYNISNLNYRVHGFDFNNKFTFKDHKLNTLLNKHKKQNKLKYWKNEKKFL